MLIRIISAVIGIIALVAALLCPYTLILAVPAAFLAAFSVWELLYNTKIVKSRVYTIIGMAFSGVGVLIMYQLQKLYTESLLYVTEDMKSLLTILMALPLAYAVVTIVAFAISQMVNRKKGDASEAMPLENACYAFLLTWYPTIGFGCMLMLREMRTHGLWLMILLFVIAWISDTGAYFVGTFLGKHKMAPKISPKKSWEGFFGGWVISVLVAVGLFILRFEIDNFYGEGLFYTLYFYLPVVTILAPLSVVGDLVASVVKRKCGIKDFGNIMPGHGGVMDRFDSVLFIAPLLYLIAANANQMMSFIAGLLNG